MGAAAVLGAPSRTLAEPSPETTRIRLVKTPSMCTAPQYVAKELLRAEGFSDVQYVPDVVEVGTSRPIALGEADMSMSFVAPLLVRMSTDQPIVVLSGVHERLGKARGLAWYLA